MTSHCLRRQTEERVLIFISMWTTKAPLYSVEQCTYCNIEWKLLNAFSCDQSALRTVLSARPSVRPSATFSQCSCHRIIMKFSISVDRCDDHAKGQGERWKVLVIDFDPNIMFADCKFKFTDGYEMTYKAWGGIEKVPYCFFKVICQISRSYGTKNRQFLPKLSIFGLQLLFEFTDGFAMMHKARNSIEEVPYCA